MKNEPIYQLTINPENVSSKLNEKEKERLNRKLTTVTGWTINDFSKYVSPPFSYTWSAGLFNGTRSNASWKEQSVFALDFDKNTPHIDDILSRCKEYNLSPQLYYETFSHTTKKPRYRVVFFLDKPITERKLFKHIIMALFKIFPEADQSCKDESRYFFGGVSSTVLHSGPISQDQFMESIDISSRTNDSGSMRSIPFYSDYHSRKKDASKPDILNNKNKIIDFEANGSGGNSPKGNDPPPTSITRGKQKIDINQARQKIRILDEFLNGTWMHHNQLLGLATNLIHIEGGSKLMKNTMLRFNQEGKTQYTENNFSILPYIKRMEYSPQPVYKFSTYQEDKNLLDIISSTKDTRGQIEIMDAPIKIKLKDAEEQLYRTIDNVLHTSKKNEIHIIKVPTSIGKTKLLENVNATIAVPTNALKNELSKRMKIHHTITPDPAMFSDKFINEKIKHYHKIGLPKKGMQVIYNIISPGNPSNVSDKDIQIARDYISQLNMLIDKNKAIITTHSRALFSDFPHNTLIFDEDPLNSLLDIKEFRLSDMFAINLIGKIDGLKEAFKTLEGSNTEDFTPTPNFTINTDQLIDVVSKDKDYNGSKSNIIEFFGSSFFVRNKYDINLFYYINEKEIPKNKKVIILSATIPTEIYKKLYGDRVHVHDITDVQQEGTVIQHTSRSCSRYGLGNYVKKISEMVGDKPVITFKSFGQYFNNPVEDMYYGNCSGYDSLKGRNIAVVGTPHHNTVEYFLTAKVMGIDFDKADKEMMFHKIEYNGFKFKFNCFPHEGLRNIQLSLIEADLIQAVGRARTLRTNATVGLYSNFPLKVTDEFIY
ncbi:hypothetical protein ACFLSY_10850 [Bacteroidota bacterium]